MGGFNTHMRGAIGQRQSGVALAILVWFLAAMSILVAGIVYQARMDIKLAQLQIGRAEAQAAGDGAINLALAELMIREQEGEFQNRGIQRSAFEFVNIQVTVNITPITGLVNLNLASEELLALVFAFGEEAGGGGGQDLARNVVEWRSLGVGAGMIETQAGVDSPRRGRFEAIEDVLLVEGVNRTVFENIKDSVYVASGGQSGVDWQSAPVSVLAMLSSKNEDTAREMAQSRAFDFSAETSMPDGMNLLFQEEQSLPLFRIDALVKVRGMKYQRRRWVERAKVGADGLPWRFFRTEPVAALNKKEREMLDIFERAHAGS